MLATATLVFVIAGGCPWSPGSGLVFAAALLQDGGQEKEHSPAVELPLDAPARRNEP